MSDFDYKETEILKLLVSLLLEGYDLMVIDPSGEKGVIRLTKKDVPLFVPPIGASGPVRKKGKKVT